MLAEIEPRAPASLVHRPKALPVEVGGGFREKDTLKNGDVSGYETHCQSWYKQSFQDRNCVKPNSTTSLKAWGIPTRLHSVPNATRHFLSNFSFFLYKYSHLKKINLTVYVHIMYCKWYSQDIYLALLRARCEKCRVDFNELELECSVGNIFRSGFFCVQWLKTFDINLLLAAHRDSNNL